jgi:two-component system OmpR family sensor kinase
MLFVSYKTNALTQTTIETLLKEKYLQVSNELFTSLSNNDTIDLKKKLKEFNFQTVENIKHYFESSSILYEYNTELSTIKILRHEDNKYLLYMKYLDDEILIMDSSQDEIFKDKEFLNSMILVDIMILIILSLIILKMIYPLKEMSQTIKKFGEGSYTLRMQQMSNDEIGEVAKTFNAMALNIEELITSRQRLLRDIGHELKTPISKAKLSIEMIEESKYKKILKKTLLEIDAMTNELLYIEKLNANQQNFTIQSFNCETLITQSLSKLFMDDELSVHVVIESNFTIEGDLYYLSIALKNLIDNGLKYTTMKPISIIAANKKIIVESQGEALEKPLEFYCQDFTQGDNSRSQKGYGLGLGLVKRILEKHNFKLSYTCQDKYNRFIIEF